MKEIKFKLFLLAMAILMVTSVSVLHWTTYQTGMRDGLKEGEVYVQDGTEIYVADEKDYLWVKSDSDVDIRIAEEGEEGTTLENSTTGVFDLEAIYVPITRVIIEDADGEDIGVLDWSTGKLEFSGKMSSSARSFFKYFLKPYVDGYIAGLSYEEAIELKQKFPVVDRTFVFRNMTWPLTQILSIEEFIEWLYENDYKIARKNNESK